MLGQLVVRGDIWIAACALAEIELDAQRSAHHETGGVLAGYHAGDGSRATIVTHVLGPGPGARHAKSRFEPDSAWQEQQIAELYERSGRVTTYLGDWHSHPHGRPRPSPLDHKTARTIATTHSARSPRPLMVIIGWRRDAWEPRGYRYSRRRLRAAELIVFNNPGSALDGRRMAGECARDPA